MKFSGQSFNGIYDYCDAVVSEYMYADGWNNIKTVVEFFSTMTDEELVEDLLANWPDLLPVMEENEITSKHMIRAMNDLRHNVNEEMNENSH